MRVLIISALLIMATTIASACPTADEETLAKSSPVVQSSSRWLPR